MAVGHGNMVERDEGHWSMSLEDRTELSPEAREDAADHLRHGAGWSAMDVACPLRRYVTGFQIFRVPRAQLRWQEMADAAELDALDRRGRLECARWPGAGDTS